MNTPEVICPHCKRVQYWKNQDRCINGCLWSNWFRARVAESLGLLVRRAGL